MESDKENSFFLMKDLLSDTDEENKTKDDNPKVKTLSKNHTDKLTKKQIKNAKYQKKQSVNKLIKETSVFNADITSDNDMEKGEEDDGMFLMDNLLSDTDEEHKIKDDNPKVKTSPNKNTLPVKLSKKQMKNAKYQQKQSLLIDTKEHVDKPTKKKKKKAKYIKKVPFFIRRDQTPPEKQADKVKNNRIILKNTKYPKRQLVSLDMYKKNDEFTEKIIKESLVFNANIASDNDTDKVEDGMFLMNNLLSDTDEENQNKDDSPKVKTPLNKHTDKLTKKQMKNAKYQKKQSLLLDINQKVNSTEEECMPKDFKGFGLRKDIMLGLEYYGYSEPTELQQICIPEFKKGGDCIIQAPGGAGKTSACVMAVLDMLPPEVKPNVLMILVLCHSNLAATHIQQEFCMLSKHMTGVTIQTGEEICEQSTEGLVQPTVLIGTPEVLCKITEKPGARDFYVKVKQVIIENSDLMCLNIHTDHMFGHIGHKQQRIFTSMTLTPDAIDKCKSHMVQNAFTIYSTIVNLIPQQIKQYFLFTGDKHSEESYDNLAELLKTRFTQAMVFATKNRVEEICNFLATERLDFCCYHEGMSEAEKEVNLRDFQDEESKIMVCTDVLSRVRISERVDFVINYIIPDDPHTYIHRIDKASSLFSHNDYGVVVNLSTEPLKMVETDASNGEIFSCFGECPKELPMNSLESVSFDSTEHNSFVHELDFETLITKTRETQRKFALSFKDNKLNHLDRPLPVNNKQATEPDKEPARRKATIPRKDVIAERSSVSYRTDKLNVAKMMLRRDCTISNLAPKSLKSNGNVSTAACVIL